MVDLINEIDYFKKRQLNDEKRVASFKQEGKLIKMFEGEGGRICDIGCSTGEFIEAIDWKGPKYGMELSEFAIDESKSRGICFEKNILTERSYFDAIIMRGVIQHLEAPFEYLKKSHTSLKEGGHLYILATPNAGSVYYKIHESLPCLNYSKTHFYIPSVKTLCNVLDTYGFEITVVELPYLSSPYSNVGVDHISFIASLITRRPPKTAFWGNMMNIVATKV